MKNCCYYVKNHFDLTWRRGWQKRFKDKGKTYVSYSDLECWYMLDNIMLAKKYPEYKFQIESVAVLKNFIKKYPEHKAIIKKWLHEGRTYVSLTGDNIVDTNMIGGETIVRNFLYGQKWLKDNFDFVPDIADRHDAFGQTAQLPQILNDFGAKWMSNITYTLPTAKYFKGLDGSQIYAENYPYWGSSGGTLKYRPCPVCKGKGDGCTACNGRGIDIDYMKEVCTKLSLREENIENSDFGVIWAGGEEILPDERFISDVENLSKRFETHFVTLKDIYDGFVKANKEKADKNDLCGPELNPNSTGCYISRSRIKRAFRSIENMMLSVETLSVIAAINGCDYPYDELSEIWENIHFLSFHDSITGTTVDPAFNEIMDIVKKTVKRILKLQKTVLGYLKKSNGYSLINTSGVSGDFVAELPNDLTIEALRDKNGNIYNVFEIPTTSAESKKGIFVPNMTPFSSIQFEPAEKVSTDDVAVDDSFIESDEWKIEFDECGVTSVFNKRLGKTISSTGNYRPFEIILEQDDGSPWMTFNTIALERHLSQMTKVVGVEKNNSYQAVKFDTVVSIIWCTSCQKIHIKCNIVTYSGSRDIRVYVTTDWDEFNRRIRVAIPADFAGKHIYEIPYGMLERPEYKPDDYKYTFNWNRADGDWAAYNFAGISTDKLSLAVMNRGIPSYRIVSNGNGTETIFVSMLRSPAAPTCLHEPISYTMQQYDGMRDSGVHDQELAIRAYDTDFESSSVVADAAAFNRGLVFAKGNCDISALPKIKANSTRITSVKLTEDKKAVLMRLVNYSSKNDNVEIHLPDWCKKIVRSDMTEASVENLGSKKITKLTAKPYKIITIRFEF